jgi:hypothetical protein
VGPDPDEVAVADGLPSPVVVEVEVEVVATLEELPPPFALSPGGASVEQAADARRAATDMGRTTRMEFASARKGSREPGTRKKVSGRPT